MAENEEMKAEFIKNVKIKEKINAFFEGRKNVKKQKM